METIKDRIKQLAVIDGISIPEIEKKCGFGNGTIGKWDEFSPTALKLNKVAKVLGTSMEYLLTGESDFSDQYSSSEPLSAGDKILFQTLRNCTEEEKIRAAKILQVLKE